MFSRRVLLLEAFQPARKTKTVRKVGRNMATVQPRSRTSNITGRLSLLAILHAPFPAMATRPRSLVFRHANLNVNPLDVRVSTGLDDEYHGFDSVYTSIEFVGKPPRSVPASRDYFFIREGTLLERNHAWCYSSLKALETGLTAVRQVLRNQRLWKIFSI